MEPEGSYPCSQQLTICPYPHPHEFRLGPAILIKFYFNILLISVRRYLWWCLRDV